MRILHRVAALIMVAAWAIAPVRATVSVGEFDEASALEVSQAALGREIRSYSFETASGEAIDLDRLRGKPVVISMIYSSCYHFCPLITESLYRAVSGARDALGDDEFTVLSIGFDTDYDTPKRMAAYASSRGIDLPNWYFVSAAPETVSRLSEDTGFLYYEASWGGFEHLAQVSVIDQQGRVFAQVYGTEFEPPALIEPLKDLIFGRDAATVSLEGLIDRIRLFCTIYDPRSDRYHFDYSIVVGLIIGSLVLGSIGFVLGRNAWRLWRDGTPG
jgi:protein SCO1/2